MLYQGICFFLSLFVSISCFAGDTRFYFCKGDDVELVLFRIFKTKENLLELDFNDYHVNTNQLTLDERNEQLFINTAITSEVSVSFELELPYTLPIKQNGVEDFRQKFTSVATLHTSAGNLEKEMDCQIYGLKKRFFDSIVPAFP